ncbi:MAG TPA: hypothetical protein VJ602_07850 [Paludibacter sp.]|nr:hypothetical protein [Paludibacter sp.]
MWGQATLPFAYDAGNPGSSIVGLTQSGLGTVDYSSSPKMKFSSTGASLTLNFTGTPGVLSFKIKWYQMTSASRFPGDFTLMESSDGKMYTIVQVYNSTNGTALTNGIVVTETFSTLLPTSRYVKWIYTTRVNGNIAIGAINLTAGAVLSVSSKALSGFTYIYGNASTVERSFTVGGNNFTHDISITPPLDYEISTGTGSSFQPANTVVLSPLGGIINNTTIYARLKSGLTTSNYNENILVSSIDAASQTVSCVGSVTPVPTLAVSDVSNLSLNATVGSSNSQTINVSAVNLSHDLGLSLIGADANQFSLSQYSVPLAAGSVPKTIITVTYSPNSVGNHTATLMMSSNGAMDVSRTLNGVSTVGTGLDDVSTRLSVSVFDGNIIFTSTTADETVQIYNAIGQKIMQRPIIEGLNKIPVSEKGVLLVKVGNRVGKVIL